MFTKKYEFRGLLSLLIGIILIMTGMLSIAPVQAQEPTPSPDDGCISCHENLYYLHDTGKWLCQCTRQMTCTCCHGGNPDVFTEDEAHAGMVLYPTRNDASACQKCHQEDYETRVERFANIAGISPVHPPIPTLTPVANISNHSSDNGSSTWSLIRLLEPWQQVGLGFLAILLVVFIILGYRCWKADCLVRDQK